MVAIVAASLHFWFQTLGQTPQTALCFCSMTGMWCTSQLKARKRGNAFDFMNDVGKPKEARQRGPQQMLAAVEMIKGKAVGWPVQTGRSSGQVDDPKPFL